MPKQHKVRIYGLATELGLSNKEVLAAAEQLGIKAKSHASQVSQADASRITLHLADGRPVKEVMRQGRDGSLTKKERRSVVTGADRIQQRADNLEQMRAQQRAQAKSNRDTAGSPAPAARATSAPAVSAPAAQKLTGSALVDHCLQGLADGVAETSICIRAGYKVDDIGQFRRAFSREAKVALAPLNRMAAERSMRLSAVKQPPAAEPELPPIAVADREVRTVTTSARVRNAGFRAGVLMRHGARCVCCGMALPELVEAAHIVPVANDGSDSPTNGLPLCPTHHSAFDRHLFAINPDTLEIQLADELTAEMLQITESRLQAEVSEEALRIRWEMFLGG